MAISVVEWALPGASLLLMLCALYAWWRASSIRSGLLARDLYKSISFGSGQQELRLSEVVNAFRKKYGGDLVTFPEENKALLVTSVFQGKVAEAVQLGKDFRLSLDIPLAFPILLGTREYMHVPRPL